jgi:hypothetical protein
VRPSRATVILLRLILPRAGLPKKTQTFLFFQIDNARVYEFRMQLAELVPLITTTVQVMNDQKKIVHHKKSVASQRATQEYLETSDGQEHLTPELLKLSGLNLAFSEKGLEKVGRVVIYDAHLDEARRVANFRFLFSQMGLVDPDPNKDTIGDPVFSLGMFADANNLGDQVSNWAPAFKNDIDGLIMVTGDCHWTVKERLAEVKEIFLVGQTNAIIHQVLCVVGDVRPGREAGHEQFVWGLLSRNLLTLTMYCSFGFDDGISQPAVQGLPTDPNPGHGTPIRPGIILLGRDGDGAKGPKDHTQATRPPWALDGSFLSFRLLSQRVPEFNAFLEDNATSDVGSDLLGARLVGRWKSGTFYLHYCSQVMTSIIMR